MIEKKFYMEDSSLSEIEAIKKRSWIHENNIIWVNELPKLTPFSININFDQMDLLATNMPYYSLIIDLRDSERPDAKTRRSINKRFLQTKDKLIHCAYITGKSVLVNAAIKFVMYGMDHSSYSVNRNETDALKKANWHLKKMNHELQPR